LIDGEKKTIVEAEISGSEDIAALVGYDTIESDAIDSDNAIHFDEECFIRQSSGKFQVDKLIPVSGKAVVSGKAADGAITDVSLTIDELRNRLVYQ
jgi:hypothetical protein